MKKVFFIIAILNVLLTLELCAQLNLGLPGIAGKPAATTILKDYESIGINPSNLGWEDNKRVSIGFVYIHSDLESKALTRDEVVHVIKNIGNDFTMEDKSMYAKLFSSKDGINFNTNICWLGMSVNMNRFGGLAINLRDRVISHFSANQYFSDILFKGSSSEFLKDSSIYSEPVSKVFSGSDIQFEHIREFNAAYGVKILNIGSVAKIYGGIGYRYIWGLSYLKIKADNNNLTAMSSLNGSDAIINMGIVDSLKISNAFSGAENIFNSPGRGYGFDFGASALLFKKLRLGVSLLNVGSITWNKETYEGNNINMKKLDSTITGMKNFNVIDQIGYVFNKDGLFEFKKVSSFKTSLPKELRVGAGLKVSKRFSIGADVVTQLSDAYGKQGESFYSIGGELNLFNILKVNSGVSGNSETGLNIPLGITISTKGFYEIYVATNDILAYIDNNRNPLLSLAVCAIRINIPKKEK